MNFDDERTTLANAMPPSVYDAQTSPIRHPSNITGTERLSGTSTLLSARLSTPPTDLPVSLCAPAAPASRSPPASVSSLRPRLFANGSNDGSPYQENVAWANSTRFPTANVNSWKQEGQRNSLQSPRLSRGFFHSTTRFRTPWRPGKWKRFPWKGLGALFLAVLLNGVSVLIILTSNGKTPEEWKLGSQSVQPQVYLSVLEIFTSLLVCCAFAEGLAVRFWVNILRGSTVTNIHSTYDSSSLWPAVRHIFQLKLNTIAISSIFTTLSFAKGPLFQRASTLSNNHYQTNYTFLTLSLITSFFSILAILPLYHGYWSLGRPMSFNPLEIARAFGAPLFDGLDGNTTASDIDAERGGTRVKYGVCERYGVEKILRVEDTSVVNVRAPRETEILG